MVVIRINRAATVRERNWNMEFLVLFRLLTRAARQDKKTIYVLAFFDIFILKTTIFE
jgi:hypothetical protein